MQFEDFTPGRVIDAGSAELTEEALLDFAKQWDPQPFHIDKEAAAASRWKGLIASGWQTCAMAMRLACDNVLAGSHSIGAPGIDELRWLAPVRAGDRLTLTLHVLDSRISSSGEIGIVRWRWEVHTQTGTQVLMLVASTFFQRPTPTSN
jgi:acyl dehydratase